MLEGIESIAKYTGLAGIAIVGFGYLSGKIIGLPIFPKMTRQSSDSFLNRLLLYGFILSLTAIVLSQVRPVIEKCFAGNEKAEIRQSELHLDVEDIGENAGPGEWVVQFTLSNPGKGLAIIDSISLAVLDSIEDHARVSEARVMTYDKKVKIDPKKRGNILVDDKGFKYSNGEVDRFKYGLEATETGHDCFFQVEVKWLDALAKEKKVTKSDILVAKFASFDNVGLDRNAESRRFEEQIKKIDLKIAELKLKHQ